MPRVRLTNEYVKDFLAKEGYTLLSEYITSRSQILIQCDKGHPPYKTYFHHFQSNHRCAICKKTATHKYDDVKKYFEKYKYKLLSTTYKNNTSKLLVQCDKGHLPYKVTFSAFLNKETRCPYCTNRAKLTLEYIKEYVNNAKYKLLSKKYVNIRTKIEVQCDKGHSPYKVYFHHFQNGSRCPACNDSKGERKIAEVLTNNNVQFERQFTFKDCRNKRPLPFDFAVFNTDKLRLLIEFDGRQHFEAIDYYGGEKEFIKRQKHDAIKNLYCDKNNIKLIRIPYTKINDIENILKQEVVI